MTPTAFARQAVNARGEVCAALLGLLLLLVLLIPQGGPAI
jgi:hypothetical protein